MGSASRDTNYATRIAELERGYDQLRKQVADVILQGASNAGAITTLLAKMDIVHRDLTELKDLARSFIPRQEVDRQIDEVQKRLDDLHQNFISLTKETHEAIVEMGQFQLQTMKALHANTKATYVAALGVAVTVIGWFSAPAAADYIHRVWKVPPAVTQTK